MKNPILNNAVIGALVAIIGKMVYHLMFLEVNNADMYSRFFYLLCFLAALFVGLRSWKVQHPGSPFTEDIKAGMKVASIFAIIISGFTWLYYSQINPEYFADRIAQVMASAQESGLEGEKLENATNTASFIFNSFTHSTLTLFGYVAMGFFYTIILVGIFRYKPKAFGI